MKRERRDRGETLVEILFTIVIIGVTAGGLLASLGTAGEAGNSQRASVRIDSVLRNYATAMKAATQSCVAGGAYAVAYAPPPGFTVVVSPGLPTTCPAATPLQSVLTLSVTDPTGFSDSMDLRLRTP